MHNYSIDSDIRKQALIKITILGIVLVLIIGIILNSIGVDFIPLEIKFPQIVIIISKLFSTGVSISLGLYWIFSEYAWKLLRRFHKVPNLNGIWEGNYVSSYKEKGKNVTGITTINIKQTWNKIKIESHSNKSQSHSVIAGILFNGTNGIELRYEYYNKSDRNMVKTMNKHYGLNALTYDESLDKLEGIYYTDKDRHTYGTIEVIRKN